MGHAEYAVGGVDWNKNIKTIFDDPEDVLNFDSWEQLGARNTDEINNPTESASKVQQ
jgi:nucleosome binding factor SPN SPT16 subunit